MFVYSTLIILTAIFGIIFYYTGTNKKGEYSNIGLFFILVVWVTVYSIRYKTGTDFSGYVKDYFRAAAFPYHEYIDLFRDKGFYTLTWILNRLFRNEWLPYNIILAVLTYYPILVVIQKKCDHFVISILLYIFTMGYYAGFNGVRQSIAVSLVFYAYYIYFEENRYLKYFLLVLIAFSVHSTAIIVIPFHFLSKVKVKSRLYIPLVIVFVISFIALSGFWSGFIDALEFMGQEKLASDYADISDDEGSSITRFLVAALPVALTYIFYNQFKTVRPDGEDDYMDNDIMLCTYTALFSLLSIKYWGFSRVGLYFSTSQVMLIPRLSNAFKERRVKIAILIIISALYFAYMIALLLHGEGRLLPYRFLFDYELTGNWNDYNY